MSTPDFLYSFIHHWTFGLFPPFSYCETLYGHGCINVFPWRSSVNIFCNAVFTSVTTSLTFSISFSLFVSVPISLLTLPSFPGGSVVKNLPALQETQETLVQSLHQDDPLEKEMVTHSSIPSCEIPWTKGAWWATVQRITKSQTQLSMHAHLAYAFQFSHLFWGFFYCCLLMFFIKCCSKVFV